MKAKIAFDFYHDGMHPTRYEPGDELPEDVAVPAEWVEESQPVADDSKSKPGDELPKAGKGGKK